MTQPDERAEELLRKHDISEPPVPVELIAQREGMRIGKHRFDGHESGFALRDGHTLIIGVNSLHSSRRQRFTIAHEIGHLKMHEGRQLTLDSSVRINSRDNVSSLATDREEIQANAFAAALLMPTAMVFESVKREIAQGDIGRDSLIAKLAREFDVSTEAMGYRLINLGILA
ncbi:MAG: ImmA/IrrE family metallo-endopeptidase [Gemmatimonadales bacterium]